MASVHHRGTVSIDVTPGLQSVWLKMDLCRSAPVNVVLASDATVALEAIVPNPLVGAVLTFVRPARVFKLRVTEHRP